MSICNRADSATIPSLRQCSNVGCHLIELHKNCYFMKRIISVLIFLPFLSSGQQNPESSSIILHTRKLKPILDSINYIEAKPRLAIIKYLHSNQLNPVNYFIDSAVQKKRDTLYIPVWDIVGVQTINRYEKRKDSLERVQAYTKGKKLKSVLPNGNPGNCFTVTYDLTKNEIVDTGFWQ